jgi:hypothetical protein
MFVFIVVEGQQVPLNGPRGLTRKEKEKETTHHPDRRHLIRNRKKQK